MENSKIQIMEYHSWEYRAAIICSIPEPKHPEGAYVQAFYIKHGEKNWTLLNGVQFVDVLREGKLLNKEDFEEMFGRIGKELPDLSTLPI
jgi:hypothetical protein